MTSSSSSVIQVGHKLTMNEEDIVDVSSALIFRVPKTLRDSKDRLYSPYLVSIGPFHYGRPELRAMEESKSEAVRRMQKRIQKNDPNASIKSIVEEDILLKEKEIREFYGEYKLEYSAIELAWMVTRDACFLFEFLVNYVGGSSKKGRPFYDKEVAEFEWTYDPIFDVTYQNPTREKLMDDILLFENQIPLWVLKHLLTEKVSTHDENQRLSTLMNLLLIRTTRHKIFMWHLEHDYNDCGHVLEVVYRGMVGRDVSSYVNSQAVPLPSSSPNRIWFCFISVVASMKAICGCWCTRPREKAKLQFVKLPTAVELTRKGVMIRPVLERLVKTETREPVCSAIEVIRFDEKTSTLYLPQFRITPHSDSAMRSIIAMEVSIKERYHPRPITQFAIFMDELIDGEEDVNVLREAEVINNFLESNEQVAQLFNTLTKGIAPDERCKVIFEAREGLHSYTRIKHKILWSEFVSAYLSKPWQIIGTIGAVLLLLMTFLQMLCLFITCNP